ncbi:MAG: serine/threonine protein kinase [Planctomycetaceae bacterium]|nr:serine/threonine protein kinase [Planctomycetaceae bacterium]
MHPDQVGPYRIERRVGAGGMGNVYLGIHKVTGKKAAVKVLPPAMAREDGFVQRFQREVESLRKLSNRHIVELYEDGATDDSTFYYSMEYVDGSTLTAEIMERRRLPWKEVIEFALQIASALKAAHDAGIVHRDIKPSNLLLTKDRTIKLTDFGVASLFAMSRLTRTGGIVGTAEYMSPEQARGQRAARRSDLYSLGAVMYVMLTGRPPFTGPTANDILQKHQFSQFDKPSRYVPEIPRLLEDLVCQLLEKDPAKRPHDALVLMKRLEQIRSRLQFQEENADSRTIDRSAGGETMPPDFHEAETPSGEPGPATMVRNMMRDEATAAMVKSPVAQFFDNIFVLLAMLAFIIVVGYWLSRRPKTDPEQNLISARAVLSQPAGPAWMRARDEYLQPLLDEGVSSEYDAEIHALIDKADQYEFTRSLRADSRSSASAVSEIERLIRKTFDLYNDGDAATARDQLRLILDVARSDDRNVFLVEFLESTLKQWDGKPLANGRDELLQMLMSRVTAAADDPDELTTARAALQAAVTIYRNDEAVQKQVEEAQRLLNTSPAE